jgi:ribosomal protein S18 acetylase RimI-like enzyme
MYAQDKVPFTWRNCVVAQAGEPLGVMLAYGIDADHGTSEPRGGEDCNAQDVYYPVKMEVADSWYICGMTVFQPWRDKGIGSRFLRFAEQQAAERGFRRLSLIAFAQNEGSVRLYLRNGYRIVERRNIIPHPMLEYDGEALLMVAQV